MINGGCHAKRDIRCLVLAPAATNSESDKDAQARAVAQSIADSILAGSGLECVRAAAVAVAGYCSRGTYTLEVSDYNNAYGA